MVSLSATTAMNLPSPCWRQTALLPSWVPVPSRWIDGFISVWGSLHLLDGDRVQHEWPDHDPEQCDRDRDEPAERQRAHNVDELICEVVTKPFTLRQICDSAERCTRAAQRAASRCSLKVAERGHGGLA